MMLFEEIKDELEFQDSMRDLVLEGFISEKNAELFAFIRYHVDGELVEVEC